MIWNFCKKGLYMQILAAGNGISLQRVEKTKKPPHFCAPARELSLQWGKSTFSVSGVLAAARKVTRFCPYFAKCTRCTEEESRCSGYFLPSPTLAYPLQRKISPLQRLSKGCPQKFSNFYLFFYYFCWANPIVVQKFRAGVKDHNFFLFGWLVVAASLCLFLLLFFHYSKFGLRCKS